MIVSIDEYIKKVEKSEDKRDTIRHSYDVIKFRKDGERFCRNYYGEDKGRFYKLTIEKCKEEDYRFYVECLMDLNRQLRGHLERLNG
ncbi:MAG: hypothetical protein Q4C30_00525 [Bacteroidia bacterium]|nr:hypothetical protein [Bacteroidia bacterium]